MSRSLRLTENQRHVIAHPAHAHGLADEISLVRDAAEISPIVTRVTIDLGGTPDAAEWAKPNTAIRIEVPALDDDTALVSRVYTVRRFEAPRTIEVDVVRHGHRTPMTAWLAGIRPGDSVRVIGPRTHLLPAHDGRPIELVADEAPVGAVLWAAGERDAMRALRARCLAAGMDKADLRVFGYWKQGVSNSVIDAKRLDHFAALLKATGSTDGADDFDIDI